MKKKFMFVMCLIMVAMMGLGGCGGSSSADATTEAAVTEAAQSEGQEAEGATEEAAQGETKVAPVEKKTEEATEEETLVLQERESAGKDSEKKETEPAEEKKTPVKEKVQPLEGEQGSETEVDMTSLESNLGFTISYAEDQFDYEYEDSDYAKAASFTAKDGAAVMYVGLSEFYKEDTIESVKVQMSEATEPKEVTLGSGLKAVRIAGTDYAGQTAIFYVVENGKSVWIIQLACEESQKNDYMPLMEASANSLVFR